MTTVLTSDPASPPAARRRRRWPALVAAGAVLAATAGGWALTRGGGGPVELSLPAGDALATSCLPVSEGVPALQAMTVALAGTVTAVTPEQVTLSVDEWYRGGDAGTVVLRNAPADQQALLGATDPAVGGSYLVSAGADGVVSVCGLTGPASAELQAVYDAAY